MKRLPDLTALQGDMLDAALAPAEWRTVLARITDTFGAFGCDLYLLRGETVDFCADFGLEVSVPEYVARFLDREPRSLELRTLPAGRVTTDRAFVTPETLRTHDYYADFLPRHGLGGCIAGTALNAGAERAYLGIHYPAGNWDIGERQIQAARRLQPLLARALRLQLHLAGRQLADALRDEALDRIPQGFVALDERGRIHLANALACESLTDRAYFRVRQGRMVCADPATQAAFQACVQSAIERRDGMGGALLVGRPDARYSLYITPSRVEARDETATFAFVFITSLRRTGDDHDIAQLRALYGLTETEARLTSRLLQRDTLKIAAERLDLTYESARFLLKQVFGKVGVHTQAELVAVLLPALQRVIGPTPGRA